MNEGHVYILKNPSFGENRLKVGFTKGAVENRSKVLSAPTGVPTAYQIVYQCLTKNCVLAESEVKKRLKKYRVNDKREFYDVDQRAAIRVVMDVVDEINKTMCLTTCNPCVLEFFEIVKGWFQSGEIIEMSEELLKVKLFWLLQNEQSEGTVEIDYLYWSENTGLSSDELEKVFHNISVRVSEKDFE